MWMEPSQTRSYLNSFHFPPSNACNLVARCIVKADKMGEPVYSWRFGPTQPTEKEKINKWNKQIRYSDAWTCCWFLVFASWSQLAVNVCDGCWDNESGRDSAWPLSQPSVNEQTSRPTCHYQPSEETSNSHRLPFTWRTFRLAWKATDPKLLNIFLACFFFMYWARFNA